MKLVLCAGVFPPESGGPATFVPQLGKALVNRGHDVVVVANGEPADAIDDSFPFRVVRISPGSNRVYRYARQVLTVTRVIHWFNADIVFTNAMDWQGVLAAKMTRRPVVSKIVGDLAWQRCRRDGGLTDDIEAFERETYSPRIEALKRVRTKQAQLATEVVVPSQYLKDLVVKWGINPDDVTVIYNSIDSRDEVPKYDDRQRRITTVGRLVNWKGIDDLLYAFGEIAEEYPDLEFHVVGDGPERAHLEEIAKKISLEDRTTFHGRVSHEEVLSILSGSLVFALNSTYEGLPHVVLEAMACGTPSVVSDAGGNPEVVSHGKHGFVCDQGDSSAFAARFEELLTDESTWRTFQSTCLERVETTFDFESMIDAYEQLLLNIK